MRIVVTGASGFLGSALVAELRRQGVYTVPVSRRPLPDGIRVGDYRETPAGDVLVHLAEESDRAVANRSGEALLQSAQALLTALFSKGYGRIVYASSAVLYGDESEALHRVGDPLRAVDVYSLMKMNGETMVTAVDGGLVARLSNLFGPGMSGGNVVSTILSQIPGEGPVPGEKPIIVRDETPVRDFLWIENAARALADMATGPLPAGFGKIFNVASGTAVSVRKLAEAALASAGQTARPVMASAPANRNSTIRVDISATTEAWGWRPKVTLQEGLSILISLSAEKAVRHG